MKKMKQKPLLQSQSSRLEPKWCSVFGLAVYDATSKQLKQIE